MADGENVEPREDPMGQQVPREEEPEPHAEIWMELRDSLPGDRAIVSVEQDGVLLGWLASKKYVHPKAVAEFTDQAKRLARECPSVQNQPSAR